MNRREFLKYAAAGALGMLINPEITEASRLPTWEPPIYKRFLQFTEYEKRPATEFIVIHHTGFPNVDKDSTVAEIHKFHQEVNGWAGIGYHYLIRKNGMIEQGRRPEMIGAHALHNNQKSVGICLAGNFDIGKPTKEQLAAVKELTAWLCQKYNLDPMAKGVIIGHRDVNDTACPGEHMYKKLEEIRLFCRDFN